MMIKLISWLLSLFTTTDILISYMLVTICFQYTTSKSHFFRLNGFSRGKTRTVDSPPESPDDLPWWNFDGSSTSQSTGENSDVLLKPVSIFKLVKLNLGLPVLSKEKTWEWDNCFLPLRLKIDIIVSSICSQTSIYRASSGKAKLLGKLRDTVSKIII